MFSFQKFRNFEIAIEDDCSVLSIVLLDAIMNVTLDSIQCAEENGSSKHHPQHQRNRRLLNMQATEGEFVWRLLVGTGFRFHWQLHNYFERHANHF